MNNDIERTLNDWIEAVLIVADSEGMSDSQIIPTWPKDVDDHYPPLTVGAVREWKAAQQAGSGEAVYQWKIGECWSDCSEEDFSGRFNKPRIDRRILYTHPSASVPEDFRRILVELAQAHQRYRMDISDNPAKYAKVVWSIINELFIDEANDCDRDPVALLTAAPQPVGEGWMPNLEWAVQKCKAMQSQGFTHTRLDVLQKDFENAIDVSRPKPPEGDEAPPLDDPEWWNENAPKDAEYYLFDPKPSHDRWYKWGKSAGGNPTLFYASSNHRRWVPLALPGGNIPDRAVKRPNPPQS